MVVERDDIHVTKIVSMGCCEGNRCDGNEAGARLMALAVIYVMNLSIILMMAILVIWLT